MINKIEYSYLWTPDIMRLSGILNENKNINCVEQNKDDKLECKQNKKSCKNSKIHFVKGKGRYVHWNFEPKMIIDLDWVELNSEQPVNVILVKKEKNNSSRK